MLGVSLLLSKFLVFYVCSQIEMPYIQLLMLLNWRYIRDKTLINNFWGICLNNICTDLALWLSLETIISKFKMLENCAACQIFLLEYLLSVFFSCQNLHCVLSTFSWEIIWENNIVILVPIQNIMKLSSNTIWELREAGAERSWHCNFFKMWFIYSEV